MMQELKSYKNELILAFTLLLLIIALVYKQGKVSSINSSENGTSSSLQELKEIIALKKVWGEEKITKKVEKLQNIISPSKMKWSLKGKKLTATFKNLSAQEFNKIMMKIMNLAVELQKLDVSNTGTSYQVELKCKW
ncbi:MAG TPA: hypothetical protein EYG93_02230 [Sulfurospirillum arcachonense]|nr:hypothetical protein [Sulfurospirillum arcachonense]